MCLKNPYEIGLKCLLAGEKRHIRGKPYPQNLPQAASSLRVTKVQLLNQKNVKPSQKSVLRITGRVWVAGDWLQGHPCGPRQFGSGWKQVTTSQHCTHSDTVKKGQ